MKISIDKQLLLDNLSIASKAVPTRTTKPILECVLIEARDSVKLYGNDMELGIETAGIPADIAEDGGVAVNSKIFMDIVRKMPGDLIQIASDETNVVKIKSEKTQMKVLGQNAEEFPTLPDVEKDMEFSLKAAAFREMIHQTIFSVAIIDTKPVLTGELLQIHENSVNLVAVDGFRIAYRHLIDENLDPEANFEVVIPAKSLGELMRLLPTEGNDILRFHFTQKHILFELPSYTLISRLLEGEFLRYAHVFNEDFNTYVRVKRQDLLLSLERASLLAKEEKKVPVKLSIGQDNIVITSNAELGTAYDEVAADIDGVTLDIAFNPRFIIDALRVMNDEEVILTFTGALSPCIMKGADSDDYKYLVLPLRLKI
jgi:DNA polymerase-3 subunit beta